MNTLRDYLVKKKSKENPEQDIVRRIELLEEEFMRKVESIIQKARDEVKKNLEGELFKELLEPAESVAKSTAEDAISDFRAEVRDSVRQAIASVEAIGREVMRTAQAETSALKTKIELSFKSELERVEEMNDKSLATVAKRLEKMRGPKGDDGKSVDQEEVIRRVRAKVKDGSPDEPEEIATKLNTLEGAVSIKVIKGLSNILTNFQRSLREKGGGSSGGGGMGNVVPETFSVGSSTTSITLASNVASNGRAMWLNYQGQQQQYGVHFTISGKVVTLLFTPVDGTYIDLIYIRR